MTTAMTNAEALRELGVTEQTLSQAERDALDRDGFVAMPGMLSQAQIEEMRHRLAELLAEEKENAGKEVHQEAGTARLSNLVDKGDVFRVLVTHPRLLAALAHVLSNDMKLSSINSRAALPGQGLQPLHADWQGAVEPGNYRVCNSIWLLDDFVPENGPTRVVAGSHRSGKSPAQVMQDPMTAHPEETLVLAPAGTAVIFNSHTWHGGTLNRTGQSRRAVHSYWTRRSEPQQLDQRKHLSAETVAGLSAPLRYLLDV